MSLKNESQEVDIPTFEGVVHFPRRLRPLIPITRDTRASLGVTITLIVCAVKHDVNKSRFAPFRGVFCVMPISLHESRQIA